MLLYGCSCDGNNQSRDGKTDSAKRPEGCILALLSQCRIDLLSNPSSCRLTIVVGADSGSNKEKPREEYEDSEDSNRRVTHGIFLPRPRFVKAESKSEDPSAFEIVMK